MVKLASSAPSRSAIATKGAAVAPKWAGPPLPSGSASSTFTWCTASGTASRSMVNRGASVACGDTSTPGSVGAPGCAIHSSRTVPRSSAQVVQATTGWPADTRISRRAWGKGWFCPRTSSAVIASVPSVLCGVRWW